MRRKKEGGKGRDDKEEGGRGRENGRGRVNTEG